MKISKLALVFGSALVVAGAGVGLAACSSDSSTGTPSGGDSGGTHDGSSSGDGAMSPDTATGDDSSTPTTDAGCKSTPTLHESDGGASAIFCPFGPDGGSITCNPGNGELCCINPKVNGTFPPSTCASACPYADAGGATQIQCEDSITCSANGKGSVCCAAGPVPTQNAACNYYEEKGLVATRCEATACASGEFQICGQQADCPSGKTCTPFRAKTQLGFCM